MKIHILGSGTCIPSTRRGSSSYLLTTGSEKILFDCGNGATWKLERIGVDYLDIDFVFITHFHPDHTADLIPFLFATKYPAGPARNKPLQIFGPDGFGEFFEKMRDLYGEWIVPECLEVEEIGNVGKISDNFNLEHLNTFHTDNSLAYKLVSSGKTVSYSGDTDYSDAFVEFVSGSDLLIIECSLPDRLKKKGHLAPSDVIKIANLAKPKKLALTHLYPACDEEDIFDQIDSETDCKVIMCEDLLEIEI